VAEKAGLRIAEWENMRVDEMVAGFRQKRDELDGDVVNNKMSI
jgi:hypothetical protein